MKLSKTFVVIVILAIITAVPVAYALQSRTNMLKIERSEKQELQLQIDSVEKQLQNKDQTIQQKDTELQQKQKENEQLQADLQAKLKRQEDEKIAAERTRQASVAVSAGGATYAGSGNCESYRGLVSQYNWNVSVAMKVMQAESSCNASAHNTTDNHGVCMGSFGLFQISCHSGAVYDPAENVAIAYAKYQARGWQPWGVCTSGKVACF